MIRQRKIHKTCVTTQIAAVFLCRNIFSRSWPIFAVPGVFRGVFEQVYRLVVPLNMPSCLLHEKVCYSLW